MTELEVKEDKFYVLTVKQEKKKGITLHNDMDSPVRKIKECLKGGASPDDIELIAVTMKEENFEIKNVPWSTIAMRLVKE